MSTLGWVQIIVYCIIIVALVRPLGGYMTRVFAGGRTSLSPVPFVGLLPGVVHVVGFVFLPVLAIGPVSEHPLF